DVRKEIRDLQAGLSVFLERKRARHQWAGVTLAHDDITCHFPVQRLSGVFHQRGLRIERVHVTDAAAHEQRNHRRRTRLEMRRLRCVRIEPGRLRIARGRMDDVVGQEPVLIQQVGQGDAADPAAGPEQELASRPASLAGVHGCPYLAYTNSFTLNSTWVKSLSDPLRAASKAMASSV